MSNEVILNLSFDNQTVTDLTGKWTLDGTPNATYEQIDGRDGYSIVEGSLGRCIVLNAVDQNARYDEYTVDFDMFVKPTYTSNYYFYNVFYLWSRTNPNIVGQFEGEIGEGGVLSVSLRIGGSERVGTTNYSPIGRWVHVTFTSGPTGEGDLYHTAAYVDGVKLVERTESGSSCYGNPFGISQRIIPCARDPESFLMPNGPGVCLNTYKIVEGIHVPNQKPAISLLNLSRVFNNFCTWLKGKLSTVAFTGSYNDLSNKPTISTVNDGTLTIQQNGTNVQTFTANASTNKTANITVPTKTSDLTNDSGFITSDDTKIPLAGSNQISGSLIPATTDAYDLGGSSYQWNNAYIKSLTINGVACGDILTHNASEFAYDTDVVHKSRNETISGNKTFSNSPTVIRQDVGTVGYNIKLGFKRGSEIATTNHSTFRVVDSDNEIISEICTENYADGKVAQILNVRNTNNDSSQIQSSISHLLDKTGEQDWIVPSRDNKTYLGTPANRWADVKTALINGKTPAYDADVVHVKGSDDIIDSKTFISLYTQSSGPSLWMKNTSFTMGTAPTTNRYSGIWVQDNNGTDTAYIVHQANKNNSQNLKFSVSNTDGTSVYQNALTFQGRLDGTFNFYSDNPANLGTSTNKWSKVYSDDVVHTTDNEIISGVKRFKAVIVRNEGNFTAGEAPTAQTSCMVLRHTNNDGTHSANTILSYMFTSGETMCELTQIPCIGSIARTWFRTNTDGSYNIYSYTKNGTLGTSAYKWKDVQTEKINGLNPGALSLPSTSSNAMMQIDTTSWVLDGVADIEYTPSADGYLTFANDSKLEWIKGQIQNDNNYGIYRFVYKYDSDIGGIQGVTIPCIKGKKVIMKIKGTGFYNALFIYCQGNV